MDEPRGESRSRSGKPGPRGGRGLGQRAFYWLCWTLVQALATLVYRLRVYGDQDLPDGPLLIVANHQSHLDPPLIGVAVHRREIAYLARSGLFRNPVLAWAMSACGAISLKENESDVGAMRRAIEELKSGRVVGIFPEGSRSPDGELKEFKRGAWLLMMRAKCDVLPVAIEGAFDAWPRHKPLPSVWRKRVAVAIGRPIPHAALREMGEEQGLEHLRTVIESMRAGLARSLITER